MTNAEKLILKDAMAKKAILEVLKLFDGASHKFAAECLKAALRYLDTDSQFNFKNAVKNIDSLDKTAKKN